MMYIPMALMSVKILFIDISPSEADNKNTKRVSSALGGTLGSVIAIMAIILMSVVFGWVWFFIRKKDSRYPI